MVSSLTVIDKMLEQATETLQDSNRKPHHLDAVNRIIQGVILKLLCRLYCIQNSKKYYTLNLFELYTVVKSDLKGFSKTIQEFLLNQARVAAEEISGQPWRFPFTEEETARNLALTYEFYSEVRELFSEGAAEFHKEDVTWISRCQILQNITAEMQGSDYNLMVKWISLDKLDKAFVKSKLSQISAYFEGSYYVYNKDCVVKSSNKVVGRVQVNIKPYMSLRKHGDIDEFWERFFALVLYESGDGADFNRYLRIVQECLYAIVFDLQYMHSLSERVILPNTIFRINAGVCYYFGNDNIVHTISLPDAIEMEMLCDTSVQAITSRGKGYGLRPVYSRPLSLVNARYRNLIKTAEEGQTYEDVLKLLYSKSACYAYPNILADIIISRRPDWDKLISSFESPEFFNTSEDQRRSTFDFVEVKVNLLCNWYGTEVVNKLRPFARELNTMVFNSLRQHHIFVRNPELLEGMRIHKVEVNRDYTMTYTFALAEDKRGASLDVSM